MTFVDTNAIIDVFTRDPVWFDWSMERIAAAGTHGDAMTSAVVVAELTRSFADCGELIRKLKRISIRTVPLGDQPAFVAGKAFATYRARRQRDEQARVLPDFFIGAQAVVSGVPLLTRDPRLYRRYFPELTLITPETHPDG